jgi:hypothetical protein
MHKQRLVQHINFGFYIVCTSNNNNVNNPNKKCCPANVGFKAFSIPFICLTIFIRDHLLQIFIYLRYRNPMHGNVIRKQSLAHFTSV